MKNLHLLLVEDNEGDVLLTTEALRSGKVINQISVAKDGKAAIDFLTREEALFNNNLPDLILLDINLPKKSGHQVLQFIKNTDYLKQIPVIMLTTSSSDTDVELAYKNYVNCYITKPVEVQEFMNAVREIENFWMNIVTLPE
ncbi:MAG: response regulator [Hydrotalea flava]|uniref:response regulator n=1 Tax=Hydrotalea TaxID=1004300 RepID=UPI0009439A8F|nr:MULTISPECIES: response regulator [Hydrotalea]NIM34112.1 response regulator [Hydrotalea flava]NIM36936.1 response regulator [Hydrotalea flava]NIN02128.1 response regulator [Hydrotalea flava]NIN13781.1 response regulator [Hydrotalea flava]NIO92862.1 response regulator [Hydrotalea flava]